MRKISLGDLSVGLAEKYGGFTLWIGAGAPMAAFPGSPSWESLVKKLEADNDIVAGGDFPDRLEAVSRKLGFAPFRKVLRRHLIDEVRWAEPSVETLVHQARIGARAATVVNFNIQAMSGLPFLLLHGAPTIRQSHLTKPQIRVPRRIVARDRVASIPVIHPHGALDMSGDCVMLKSEYVAHRQNLGFESAIRATFGADVVILGMSLDDDYLREAVLQHRSSIRRVFWVSTADPSPKYESWSRQAEITLVSAPSYDLLWSTLAHGCPSIGNDFVSDEWAKQVVWHVEYQTWIKDTYLGDKADELLKNDSLHADDKLEQLQDLAGDYESFGLEVPTRLASQAKLD